MNSKCCSSTCVSDITCDNCVSDSYSLIAYYMWMIWCYTSVLHSVFRAVSRHSFPACIFTGLSRSLASNVQASELIFSITRVKAPRRSASSVRQMLLSVVFGDDHRFAVLLDREVGKGDRFSWLQELARWCRASSVVNIITFWLIW